MIFKKENVVGPHPPSFARKEAPYLGGVLEIMHVSLGKECSDTFLVGKHVLVEKSIP